MKRWWLITMLIISVILVGIILDAVHDVSNQLAGILSYPYVDW